jgi:hypothetical protein
MEIPPDKVLEDLILIDTVTGTQHPFQLRKELPGVMAR